MLVTPKVQHSFGCPTFSTTTLAPKSRRWLHLPRSCLLEINLVLLLIFQSNTVSMNSSLIISIKFSGSKKTPAWWRISLLISPQNSFNYSQDLPGHLFSVLSELIRECILIQHACPWWLSTMLVVLVLLISSTGPRIWKVAVSALSKERDSRLKIIQYTNSKKILRIQTWCSLSEKTMPCHLLAMFKPSSIVSLKIELSSTT